MRFIMGTVENLESLHRWDLRKKRDKWKGTARGDRRSQDDKPNVDLGNEMNKTRKLFRKCWQAKSNKTQSEINNSISPGLWNISK
jgi:hypothetical protein